MEAFFVFVSIIFLVIWYFVSKEFQHIAELKGHDGTKYFWWTFFFGLVGILMVIALPFDVKTNSNDIVYSDELPEI